MNKEHLLSSPDRVERRAAHSSPHPSEPRVRFTLRRILIWFTALSLTLGAFFNSLHQQRRGIDHVHRFGGDVYYEFELDETGLSTVPDGRFPWTKFIDRRLGMDYTHHVVGVVVTHPEFDDDQLQRLSGLNRLQFVTLRETAVTGWGLQHLRCQRHLHTLRLDGKHVDDSALAALTELPNLRSLFISGASITDSGLRHLARLPKLEQLDVSHTGITPAGLHHLEQLPNLRLLSLRSCTRIANQDVQQLTESMPSLDYVEFAPALAEHYQR